MRNNTLALIGVLALIILGVLFVYNLNANYKMHTRESLSDVPNQSQLELYKLQFQAQIQKDIPKIKNRMTTSRFGYNPSLMKFRDYYDLIP